MVKIFKNARRGNYYAQYTSPDGIRKQFSCKTAQRRKAERYAQDRYAEILTEQTNKTLPSKSKISEFCDHYLNSLSSHLSAQSIKSYRDSFTQLKKRLGDISIGSLSVSQAHDFIYFHQPSTQTASRHYRQLRRAFKLAVKWGQLQMNPFDEVQPPRPLHKRKDTFTEDEFKSLISSLPVATFAQRRFKRMVLIGRVTGMRLTEILNITAEDVLVEKNVLLVRNSDTFRTKSGKNRFVPLTSYASKLISEQLEENQRHESLPLRASHLVFPNVHGFPLSKFTITERFREHVRIIIPNKPNACFHSLRGTFITKAIDDGVPISQIQLASGHTSIRTTEGYINYDLVKLLKLEQSLSKYTFTEE